MKKTISISITILVLFVVLRELLRLITSDYATSVVPGWHTPVFSPAWILNTTTLSILFLTGIAFGLFRLTNYMVERIMRSKKKEE